MGAFLPSVEATWLIRSSSSTTSTLKQRIPISSARRISSRRLPTPEKTIFSGSPPALMTRSSSPTETISKPEPSRARIFKTARLEFALTA